MKHSGHLICSVLLTTAFVAAAPTTARAACPSAWPTTVNQQDSQQIYPPGDIDYFTFTLTNPGDVVIYGGMQFGSILVGFLYNHDCSVLLASGYLSSYNAINAGRLNPGTYYLRFQGLYASTSGNYSFLVQYTQRPPEADINVTGNGVRIPDNDTTPGPGDHTDFGTVTTNSGGAVTRTYTIANVGSAALNLTATPRVTVVGTHAGDFTVAQQPSSPIAIGAQSSFQVSFTPGGVGLRQATVSIDNNDPNEHPYDFAIQGTGAAPAPEIEVVGNGQTINDGDSTASPADHTDFGPANVTGGRVQRTFTIRNTGTASLNLTGTPRVRVVGPAAGDFQVTSFPASSVAAGGSTTFQIEFDPTAVGARAATVEVVSNDADEGTFDFAILGTGQTPDIQISGSAVIQNGDFSPSTADGSDLGGIVVGANPVRRAFTIRNLGNGPLNLTGTPIIVVSGQHASDFTVVSAPNANVVAAGYTTFTIEFTPQAGGPRQARLTIANDDIDDNPFEFAVGGSGLVPEMAVYGNNAPIASGDVTPSPTDHTDFGSAEVGSFVERTFTIRNTGTARLNITGSPRVAVSGGGFQVSVQPVSAVQPGQAASFRVRFAPTAGGLQSVTVSIDNDDHDENPYVFSIQGTGLAPEISVEGNGLLIADGDTTPSASDHTQFGPADVNAGRVSRTYTIRNTGTAPLRLTGSPIVAGTHARDFALDSSPSSVIAPGTAATFAIRFDPTTTGARRATVQIVSNDIDEALYDFAVEGQGVTREISIEGNGRVINNTDSFPSLADHTDFGDAPVSAGTVTRRFTVRNLGTGELRLTGTPRVTVADGNAGDFSVTVLPASPVAPGTQTTFDVAFDPSAEGRRWTTVRIPNDDADENPYTFRIQGTGAGPEIAVEGNGQNIVDGTPFAGAYNHTDFGSADVASGQVVRTFTIRNTGGDVLRLTASPPVTLFGTGASAFSVAAAPSTSIPAGGQTTFQIRFDPASPTFHSARVEIANDDSDESLFDFAISGQGTAPEIFVEYSGRVISNGQATPSVLDGTDFGGRDVGTTFNRTYTIRNRGTGDLELTGTPRVALAGAHAADFAVVTPPQSPVRPNLSTTFEIRFAPSAGGVRRATVRVDNTDADEDPYTFAILGIGQTPEIAVEGNGQAISNGDTTASVHDHTDFGGVAVTSGAMSRTFWIHNVGTGMLELTGTPSVVIRGSGAGDFTVANYPTNRLTGGARTSMYIRFDPSTRGLRQATVSVANNDDDENPFEFDIAGTGLAPEIAVVGNGRVIQHQDVTPSLADHTDFGSVTRQVATMSRTFSIRNEGTSALRLTGLPPVVLSGAALTDFTVVQPLATTLAPGADTQFTLRLTPSAVGPREVSVAIPNDDADERPYRFTVRGTGVDQPPVAVAGPDVSIREGLTVTLDGCASHDDVDPVAQLGFQWRQVYGSTCPLADDRACRTTCTAPQVGPNGETIELSLTVTDSLGQASEDLVLVHVGHNAAPPVALATSNCPVDEGRTAVLDGSSSTADVGCRPLSFTWNQITGQQVTLSDTATATAQFAAPEVPEGGATLGFRLRVEDACGLLDHTELLCTVQNVCPVPIADAGPDQTVSARDAQTQERSWVSLDGSSSSVREGAIVAYDWRQLTGPQVTLIPSATVARPRFLAPEVDDGGAAVQMRLIVTGSCGALEASDQMTVNVVAQNQPPIADAGPDQIVAPGAEVRLDGTASLDPENQPLTFRWEAAQNVTLDDAASASPGFQAPPTEGALTFTLTVSDGHLVDSDTVVVNVTDAALPPTCDAGPDITVTEREAITLDGSASSDPLGAPLTYRWRLTAGPNLTLEDPTAAVTAVVAPDVDGNESLRFELTCESAAGLRATDEVVVVVRPAPDPTVPELVTPTRGETTAGTTVLFSWNPSETEDGASLVYDLQYGTDPQLTTYEEAEVIAALAQRLFIAGSGLLLFALALLHARRFRLLCALALLATVSGCGASDAASSSPERTLGEIQWEVSGLQPNTAYYWRVVARASTGGRATTEIQRFTSGPR